MHVVPSVSCAVTPVTSRTWFIIMDIFIPIPGFIMGFISNGIIIGIITVCGWSFAAEAGSRHQSPTSATVKERSEEKGRKGHQG